MPLKDFNATKWFWFVGDDRSRLWSSELQQYVSATDPAYLAWAASGGSPKASNTEDGLSAYLDSLGGSAAAALQRPMWYIGPIVLPKYIDREAYRRISTGFVWDGHPIQMRDEDINGVRKNDQINIAAQAQIADRAINSGAQQGDYNWCADPEMQPFVWRDANNVTFPLDAPSMIAMADAAARWKRLNTWAGSTLKSTSPIPRDFTDDRHWPVAEAE